MDPDRHVIAALRHVINAGHHALSIGIKFLVISLVTDPHFQRELDYLMAGMPGMIRRPVTFFLNGIWIYCKTLQRIILPFFLFNGRKAFKNIHCEIKGPYSQTQMSGNASCCFPVARISIPGFLCNLEGILSLFLNAFFSVVIVPSTMKTQSTLALALTSFRSRQSAKPKAP
jgi:hypothetical protein